MSMYWKWLRRRRLDRELEEEIQAHFRMAIQDRIERGESLQEAEQSARREFGHEQLVRETTRDMWGWDVWQSVGRDVNYSLRRLRRSPGFAAVAFLTLAFGLGATTAIFSIVNGVLLQPLRYREPERLYMAETIPPLDEERPPGRLPVNGRHFQEWRTHCQSCADVALFNGAELTLVGAGKPVRLPALEVSFNFFRTLGVRPAIGRDFLPEEEGDFDKVILTDALWRGRFAGDPSIAGRRIEINGESHLVVGILPPDLRLPQGGQWGAFIGPQAQPLIFRPLTRNVARESPDGSLNYSSVIRLKPGVSREQATAELNALLADYVREFHLRGKIGLTALRQQVIRKDRAPLLFLLGAVGAVLLIVCVNIGNLMLVRSASRGREAGVRLALGASRTRLFREVLMEALLLVCAGGAAGLMLAQAGLKLLVAYAPAAVARLDEVRIDWRVLCLAAAAIAISTIFCGAAPAWRLSRIQPQESLQGGSGAAGGRFGFREMMVGLEVALCTVLLVAGGLLMGSFFRLMRVDKGFAPAHVITQDVSFMNPKYARGVRRGFVEETVEKLARIPGIEAAGASSQLPLSGNGWTSNLRDPDKPHGPAEENAASFRFVTPGYFEAMSIPIRQGRYLEDADRNRPSAVLSEQAARFLWGNENPIGRHVLGAGLQKPVLEVVGVVGDVRSKLEDAPPMTVYEHFWRMQPIAMSFVLRTQGDPAAAAGGIRSVLSSADPEMAIAQARTMETILEESVSARRFEMYLAVVFAVSALALASLGIYGIASFAVARRTPEIGIRIALGAQGAQLIAMIVRQGMVPVAAGLTAGLGCSLPAGRFIASQLYGLAPGDPSVAGLVTLILVAVALCACWVPARRATQIDPMPALRQE